MSIQTTVKARQNSQPSSHGAKRKENGSPKSPLRSKSCVFEQQGCNSDRAIASCSPYRLLNQPKSSEITNTPKVRGDGTLTSITIVQPNSSAIGSDKQLSPAEAVLSSPQPAPSQVLDVGQISKKPASTAPENASDDCSSQSSTPFSREDNESQQAPMRQLQSRTTSSNVQHSETTEPVLDCHSKVFANEKSSNACLGKEVSIENELQLVAPWRYYRSHVCSVLAKYCHMCDANPGTTKTMRNGFPCLFSNLTLWDCDPNCDQSLEEQLCDLCEQFERMLPEEAKECIVYALFLVEKSFSHGLYLHSSTVKRMLAVQFGLAFKMVAEIDVGAVNAHLACLLNISLPHFNEIEGKVFEALTFNIGFTAEQFSNSLATIDTKLGQQWTSDQVKTAKLQKLSSPADLKTPETRSQSSKSPNQVDLACLEDDFLCSMETKTTTVKSSTLAGDERRQLGAQHDSGFNVCSSLDDSSSDKSSFDETTRQGSTDTGQIKQRISHNHTEAKGGKNVASTVI